jgi:predicted nucleic acid-binding protein
MLLLDAGVWVASGSAEDRFHESAGSIVLDLSRPVTALDLTLYEVANAVAVKMGKPDGARYLSGVILRRCGDGLQTIGSELFSSTVQIAAEYGLTAYDAAYVAAARANGWTLVSTDIADLVSKGLALAPDAADYP